jgi:ribosomal protein L11 methyltransferase
VSGGAGSHQICESCGTQFGYDDATPGGTEGRIRRHAELRARWIAAGMPWTSWRPIPEDWDPEAQLAVLDAVGPDVLEWSAEVRVEGEDVDLVSGLLWGAGVSAIGEEDQPDGGVVLRVGLPPGGRRALVAALGDRWRPQLVAVDAVHHAWREHARVVRAGRIVVWPPWVPLGPVGVDEVVVEIDPGPTFGHGAHPTTRLCLEALDRLVAGPSGGESPANRRATDRSGIESPANRPATDRSAIESPANRRPTSDDPPSVLDVGCGSGVLAVAAVLRGARSAVGVDIDPDAVAVTRANAERNGVAERIAVASDLTSVDGVFAVVLANIGAAALRELAPALVARVAPGGTLVLSGLLDPPPADLAAVFAPLEVVADERTDGWTALVLVRKPGRRGGVGR